MKKTTSAVAVVASILACGGSVSAESVSGAINQQWIIASPIFVPISLPAVQAIDSIQIQIAHTNGHDLVVYLDALNVTGEPNFDLMNQETASGGSTNFSMGVVFENGTLENVAPYTFVASGGGGFTAPHTPAGLINANSWLSGPLEAQDYVLTIADLSLLFDGGAIGTWTINYTPIPGPSALGVLALAACRSRRSRV